ncbi:proteinase inhibitor 1-like [Solanum tuberosum]|uniref:proteinase inhibitor 1-like n=1 Tax=Solanum tuberosum TaxID=4113 RepID=UPI00073A3BD0|nr:PREDICTED: proteinase inhibitor 1-like [Solanum tuberosum]
MESKFAHIIVFFLLAFSFETLKAQSDGLDFIKLLKELKSVESKPNLECQGKLRWPELIGVPAQYAKGIIEKENSLISNVHILLNGSPITLDIRCDRVRLFDNILGYVVDMPVVG